jgi:NUDIX domain
MAYLLAKIWRTMRGRWQWYALWFFHHKFIVGVSGVIFDDQGQILLLRHLYWREGSWGLPGGYANSGEKLEDSCERHGQRRTKPTYPASHLHLRPLKPVSLPTSPTGRAVGLRPTEILASTAHVGGAATP